VKRKFACLYLARSKHRERSKYMLMSRHQNAGQNCNKRQLTDPLKLQQSANIWEQQQQIKI
jgi:hypothetical protein